MAAAQKRIRLLFIFGFLLGISALIFVGLATLRSANDFVGTANDVAAHQKVLNLAGEIRRTLEGAENGQLGYVLTGEKDYLKSFDEAPAAMEEEFKELRRSIPNFDEDISVSEQLAEEKFADMRETLALYRRGERPYPAGSARAQYGPDLMNRFRDSISRLESRQASALDHSSRENSQNRTSAGRAVVLGLGLAILVVLISLVLVMRDLRRRMEAEDSLQRNLALQNLIFDSANVAIIASDIDGRVTLFNRTAEKWLGYSSSEVLGKADLAELIHDPKELDEARRELAEELGIEVKANGALFSLKPQRGQRYEREWSYIRNDGSRFPVSVSFSALRSPEDEIVGYVAVVTNLTKEKEARAQIEQNLRDIEAARSLTELKNRELEVVAAELKESRDIAVTATRTKSEFLANMSHEIRTPMNGVMGMAHLLQNTPLNQRQRGFVQTILSSAEGLLTILNDILDISKMEAGKMTLEHFPFNLRNTLEELCESMAATAYAKGVELTCYISPSDPEHVIGDPGRLRQVLANLISNAIKFTAEGEVSVSAAVLREVGNRVTYRLSVRDSGIGIPADRQDEIFESFTQADGSTTRRFGGTGLGLAISRQLVELMGGHIGVASEVGRGSEFWVEITLQRQEGSPDIWDRGHDLGGNRILIADDNATNRTILRELLTSWNCTVVEATSGRDAVEYARNLGDFDVAILDMHMPEMDGIETANILKRDKKTKRLPLVLLSSSGYSPDETEGPELFSSILFKPVRSSPLYDALAHVTAGTVPSPPGDQAVDSSFAEQRLKGVRVLVVEDNIVNQMVATEILASWGCECSSAENGAAAVGMIANEQYDIVLMDVQMPVMDGYEATAEIRRSEAGGARHIPIVAMTANAMSGDRERCLRAGMDGYLSKPLQPKLLLEKLMEYAGHAGTGSDPLPLGPSEGLPLLEGHQLEETCAGKVPLMIRVIERYIATSKPILEEIEAAAHEGDLVRLASAAHALKGSSLTVGSRLLGELCQIVEHSAREGGCELRRIEPIRTNWERLRLELLRFEQELRQTA